MTDNQKEIRPNPEREVCSHNIPVNWACQECNRPHVHSDGIWADCLSCCWKRIEELEDQIKSLISDRDLNKKTYFKMGDDILYLKKKLETAREALKFIKDHAHSMELNGIGTIFSRSFSELSKEALREIGE